MVSLKKFSHYFLILLYALILAVDYTVFVFPNSFAPAGIDGICTMIQDVFNISMGWLSLAINVPLLILTFIFLNREFAIKSALGAVALSIFLIVLRKMDLSWLYYHTDTGSSVVLAPIAAGTIRGILYALTLKLNASCGGVDLIAALIKRKRPYLNFMNIIFVINMLVAVTSYFVYGMKLEPVICSILYAFISSTTSNHIRAGENETIRFEIITSDAVSLCNDISQPLNQTATIMDAHGAYSGANKKVVICVIGKHKAPHLEDLMLKYTDLIIFKSYVNTSITGAGYI